MVCCVSREHACVVSRINVGSCYMQCVWVCSVCFVVACICAPTCLFFLCDAFSFRLPVLFTTCAKLVWLKLWAYTVFATTTISRFFSSSAGKGGRGGCVSTALTLAPPRTALAQATSQLTRSGRTACKKTDGGGQVVSVTCC